MDEPDSPAQLVKNFLSQHSCGSLSTLSQAVSGFPFGSVVPYDIDKRGRMVIFISLISQHYQNITAEPKGSILVSDRFGVDDPQAHARATVLGEFHPVLDEERDAVEESYWKRFPHAPERALAHNFVFFRCETVRVRWIGGFGDIRWIDAKSYTDTPRDEIAYHARGILEHMNDDHRDALQDYVRHYAKVETKAEHCKMTSVTNRNFIVTYHAENGPKKLEIPFNETLSNPGEVRTALIELLKLCRKQ